MRPTDEQLKALVTKAAVYFALCRVAGWPREQAQREFLDSPLCRNFGPELTVGDLWAFVESAGYTY